MSHSMRARLAAAPAEGWISLFLVAVLAVAVAWSLDDAALVLGQRAWTDFLPWVSLGGVAAGFIGARARWSRPVAHLIGAAFAALIVPLIIGSILDPAGSPAARYQATAASSLDAVLDFAVRGLPVTRETGHYLLVLGLLCWANGQFAASSVFRHGRPIGPIIVLGTVLVANMSATVHDQIWFLVLFSMAGLFLLTRLHALDERATWVRRRIGDPTTVGSLYLRGGTVFILVAIFGSLALTATARSAPLAGFWDDARPGLVEISQWLQRIIPAAPDAKNIGVPSFGQQVTIGGTWSTSNDPALEILRKAGDNRHVYWRATTYDNFTLFGWSSTDPVDEARPAGTSILESTADSIPETAARTTETFRIVPQSRLFKVAFSPIDPLSIDRDTTLTTSGDGGFFQAIEIAPGVPYTVTASTQELADIGGGVTQNRLRAAGRDYPDEIVAEYTDVPVGAMGRAATKLLADLKARTKQAGADTPFDLATAIVNELQSTRYQYSTNLPGVCDRDSSTVECFAVHKIGFCEHYASTMAILLREDGIPTRLVEGFLPGQLDVATGRETIRTGAAHAWVEVYFPGIGWYGFDPTGGLADPEPIPVGSVQPVPSATPRPSLALPSINPGGRIGEIGPRRAGPVATTGGPASGGPLIAVAIVLIAVVLLGAFLAYRRGPRGVTTPDGVYASVAALARRFGFGPRPTQTTFEYAAALGDILPGVRPELHTVATAKVEVAYGRRELDDDRLHALRDSYRRLRVGLLRLAFRRRDRPRRR
ncbi:MAG TPA: transglutaminase domain-containing protein [Candidatus Limnocylindrales bacterium]|nr:transglutaminase domain-containing protein [Candidatus Limnocylindrales bacterium]